MAVSYFLLSGRNTYVPVYLQKQTSDETIYGCGPVCCGDVHVAAVCAADSKGSSDLCQPQDGQSNWMTLKNNTIGWKITKAATDDRTIAMVYGRKEDGFMIKGKSVEEPPSGQGLRQHPGKNMRARL